MGNINHSTLDFFGGRLPTAHFQFSKQKDYASIYRIYSCVLFNQDIIFNSRVVSYRFQYKLMIVNKNTRDVWILNDNYDIIYHIEHLDGQPNLHSNYTETNTIGSENTKIFMKDIIDFWKSEESRKSNIWCRRGNYDKKNINDEYPKTNTNKRKTIVDEILENNNVLKVIPILIFSQLIHYLYIMNFNFYSIQHMTRCFHNISVLLLKFHYHNIFAYRHRHIYYNNSIYQFYYHQYIVHNNVYNQHMQLNCKISNTHPFFH